MKESKEEKIRKLAQQLKDLHMAGSIEEATARAKEIIETSGSEDNKSIGEMMKNEFKEDEKIEELKNELEEIKKELIEDEKESHQDKEHFKKIKKKSDELKEDIEEVEDITEIAEEVQEKK
ncbi:hypothetical protein JW851_01955 [Candidatus Woesearchaeota archaeon]|nr:hypothetical protein [Candidatus Woesearchaeota archaeon]